MRWKTASSLVVALFTAAAAATLINGAPLPSDGFTDTGGTSDVVIVIGDGTPAGHGYDLKSWDCPEQPDAR